MRIAKLNKGPSLITAGMLMALASCSSQSDNQVGALGEETTTERTEQAEAKLRQVSGTVVETKTVEVRGEDTENIVALIKTNRGDRRLSIDLGPVGEFPENLIKVGAEVSAEGRVIRVRDQQFLAANRAKVGETLINISRNQIASENPEP